MREIPWIVICLSALLLLIGFFSAPQTIPQQYFQVEELYQSALEESNLFKKEQLLNRALDLSEFLLKKGELREPLYRLQGNIFTLFQNEAMAKYSYEQASQNTPQSVFANLFFFHTYFSLQKRWAILFVLVVSLAATLSLWMRFHSYWRSASIVLAAASLLMVGSLFTSRYLEPVYALSVHPSFLWQGKEVYSGQVLEEPLATGIKLEVLKVYQSGWVKVQTPEGDIGFVSSEKIRLLHQL